MVYNKYRKEREVNTMRRYTGYDNWFDVMFDQAVKELEREELERKEQENNDNK